jgi:hypothetical protein
MNSMNTAMVDLEFEDDIPSIIVKAAESKTDFMNFINWYGFDKNSAEYKWISFLVRDENDVKLWFAKFNGNLDEIIETTDKYKEYKLKKYSMKIDEFLARCAENTKDAMEMLFCEECPKWLLRKLEDRLHSGQMSLQLIYSINQSDKWYNSLSKIVRSNF